MRESQARAIECPECKAAVGRPCIVQTGDRTGKSRSTAHSSRVKAMATFIADAYCENESQAGYKCGRPECPHCGE
jgi:hypothetical protein